jgi:hypothetical protein
MVTITKEDAVKLAEKHAGAIHLDHPDYRMECELRGNTAEGWLFTFRICCTKDIPSQDQEKFAGARGFLVSREGEIRDLSWPMYAEMEKELV